MKEVLDLIKKATELDTRVLITGEAGTGKSMIAKDIHNGSHRGSEAFVIVECRASQEDYLASELFGQMDSSFTSSTSKRSLLEIADRGTIFIDEVENLHLPLQAKLLRFIEEGQFKRVNGVDSIMVDVRIIVASTQNLEEKVLHGEFSKNLYYRLNIIHVDVPPLRERKDDIPLLVSYFVQQYSLKMGKKIERVLPEVFDLLVAYDFPGNITELETIIERAIALETSSIITEKYVRPYVNEKKTSMGIPFPKDIPKEGIELNKVIEELEKNYIVTALKKTGGVKKEAAKLLRLDFRAFRYKLEKYGL